MDLQIIVNSYFFKNIRMLFHLQNHPQAVHSYAKCMDIQTVCLLINW